MDEEYYYYHGATSTFEQNYRCYPVSFIEKAHLEKGDKANLQIDYPMLFELMNPSVGKVSHCGVLEFVADEGIIYLPCWMMENMHLQEGDMVNVKNAFLSKGTYIKLQPHSKDFLDISNPKAILEKTLRSYSCLTTGDTIMVDYNNKKFYIDIVETKPFFAVSIIETDCEVDFAPPLDYKEPENPTKPAFINKKGPKVEEEPVQKIPEFSPFTGSGRRLDGKPVLCLVLVKDHELANGVKNVSLSTAPSTSCTSRQHPGGKLVFSPNGSQSSNDKSKASSKDSKMEAPQKTEESKFKVFTGRKYSLRD